MLWWRFESALVAFQGWFGGVSRMVWWRFEDGLMAFREGFDGVWKVLC